MSNVNSPSRDTPGALMRSTSVISAGTLMSRILGFVRDIVLARFFGTGFQADAFFVAWRIPNLFRDMVGEGAVNAAVVPVFAENLARNSREEFWRITAVVFTWALMILSALTAAGILLAPWIVRVMAPGFLADPEKLRLTVRLTRLMFPYLLLIGLTAQNMAVLYSLRSFVVPAFSPCLLNLSVIAGALVSVRFLPEPTYGLALAVVVGGALQLWAHAHALKRAGGRLIRPRGLFHPTAMQIGRLLAPRLIGAGVYQLNVLVDTLCASLAVFAGAGAISAIYYANRVIQFPMGIFTIAMASAVLPTLSDQAAGARTGEIRTTLRFALDNVFFVMVPVAAILAALARPVTQLLFERGAFGAYSAGITSSALMFYAAGLFAFGGSKILVTAFYSLQDTWTPVKAAAVALGINAVLNFVLMIPLKVGGIALASAIASTVNFLILFRIIRKKVPGVEKGMKLFLLKVLAASAAAGLAAMAVAAIPWRFVFFQVLVAGMAGTVVYAAVSLVLGVEQARQVYGWIIKKLAG